MDTMVLRKSSMQNEGLKIERKPSLTKGSPFGQMLEDVKKLAVSKSLWLEDLQRDLPKKWEKHGDMIVFPQNSFSHIHWKFIGRELWEVVAKSLKVQRLGRKRTIDDMKTPHVDLLLARDGWVEYTDERNVTYAYDVSQRVFNNSKNAELKRISKLDCHGQTVVDMYTGLGYYAMTFMKSCNAKNAIAIDWNPEILESLVRTSQLNNVEDRLEILHGDCRKVTPMKVADRVYMGLIPSCRPHWLVACKALKEEGGVLHINELVDVRPVKKTTVIKKKKIVRQKTVPAILEEPESSKEVTTPETNNNTGDEVEGQEPRKKRISRCASIVEELESRVMPDPQVWKEFEGYTTLKEPLKKFAMECAQTCTRFLNNIHLSDISYTVVILNVISYGEVQGKEHVVVDLLCAQSQASLEHLSSRFASLNVSSE